jgi:cell division protein FtsI (penicillin-binding protein 3)
VVALEPATGEILALAQWPGFNPNSMRTTPAAIRKLRATSDVYEPGSTFKAFFLGILLDRKIVRPTDTIFCENGLWVCGSQRVHDTHPQGLLTVSDVLKVSSNIGVAKLSERVSPRDFHDGLKLFGIGMPSGVDLPGESKGILQPTEAWSKSTAKTMAFGQGVSATALQVTSALAAIANGGVRMAPHVVRSVLDRNGTAVKRTEPRVAGRAISPEAAEKLTRMMETVVHAEGGTGSLAAVPGFTTAGKTGTAWKPNPDGRGYARSAVVASFMGFVPSRAPRLALLVAIDEPTKGSRYGGTTAGPAFREIAAQSLAYLQVPPEADAPAVAAVPGSGERKPPVREEEPMPVAAVEETPRGTMPDLRGLTMREALRKIEGAGVAVKLTLIGSGIAATQEPAPGLPLEEGGACRVVFNPLM